MHLNPYNTHILEPAVLDPNLESSLSATGRPVEGAKDVVPLVRVYKYSRTFTLVYLFRFLIGR